MAARQPAVHRAGCSGTAAAPGSTGFRLRLREVPAFVCVRGADDDARHLKLRALIYDPTDTTGSTFGDTQDIIMDVYDSTEATNDYTHHQFTGAIRDQDVVWDDNYQGWDYV